MKKIVALALAVLFVLSMGSVAFAAVGSPMGMTVEAAGGGGTNASSIVTSEREMTAIKKNIAEQLGIDEGTITNYASARVDVGNNKGEETFTVKLNMPATLNGQTVKVAVLLKDGTWKIMTAVVENGQVIFDAPIVDGYVKFMVYTDKIYG